MARRDFKPAHLRAALRHVAAHTRACPCHACLPRRVLRIGQPLPLSTTAAAAPPRPSPNASALASTDYAFEMATSSIRYGRGVTAEVGHDLRALGATRVAIFTDAGVLRTAAFSTALASIDAAGVSRAVFSDVRVEPTDASFSAAAAWARAGGFDAYVAVGGGSTIDTAKAANLYATHSSHEFLDFVNMPIGRGMPVPGPVRPLIAIPTTAGTGSETTGVAIFDHEPTRAKTGIGSRHLRPVLGLIDPANMDSMPREVAVASGLDVLCHAIESYTALPFSERSPRPDRPELRPAYQGSNPISDVWALASLRMIATNFERSVAGDARAREAMALASTYAGIGFGNAGVHLPHGMSYPISGLCKSLPAVAAAAGARPYASAAHALIPHGVSVALPAPAVFRRTGPAAPERHRTAAEALGVDVSRCASDDGAHAGDLLAAWMVELLGRLGTPAGLADAGFRSEDVPALVAGALPQERVTKLAPVAVTRDLLEDLFTDSLVYR